MKKDSLYNEKEHNAFASIFLKLFIHTRHVTRRGVGRGGGLPCPSSKIGKKCPNLEKK